jgi:hypothetical protein
LTVIVDESPLAVPAAPLNVGVELFVNAPFAGDVNVTVGAVLSTVIDWEPDEPLLPAASDWDAETL